jgi:hypothetical protein
LEEPAASVFRERCPEEGDEQLLVNFDNHKPKHTASQPKIIFLGILMCAVAR